MKEEQLNQNTFASDVSEKIYNIDGFKDVENYLIKKYFTGFEPKVLDIGCGYGRTTDALKKMGCDVTGIDIVPRMVETAQIKYPNITFKVGDAANLEFDTESFDYVLFSFNGIDYIYPEGKRTRALYEAYRVLKPGGLFILSSHNKSPYILKALRNPQSLKIFLSNLFTGRIFTNFIKAKHEEGSLVGFAKDVPKQVQDFIEAGFEVLEVTGRRYKSSFGVNYLEAWPYYVLRKVR